MHRSMMRLRRFAAPLGLALFACGDDSVVKPSEPQQPVAIASVSGDGQEGNAGERLGERFVVRVTDAHGEGVEGVQVDWRVTSGAGELDTPQPGRRQPVLAFTGPAGEAAAVFEPTVLGTSTVAAEVPGLDGSPVTFTADATVLVVRLGPVDLADFGLLLDCDNRIYDFAGPDGSSDVTVPVGTPVEWNLSCDTHIASSTAPPGGKHFESGILEPGERFRFVPRVAGDWEYVDRFSSHAAATLEAR